MIALVLLIIALVIAIVDSIFQECCRAAAGVTDDNKRKADQIAPAADAVAWVDIDDADYELEFDDNE